MAKKRMSLTGVYHQLENISKELREIKTETTELKNNVKTQNGRVYKAEEDIRLINQRYRLNKEHTKEVTEVKNKIFSKQDRKKYAILGAIFGVVSSLFILIVQMTFKKLGLI